MDQPVPTIVVEPAKTNWLLFSLIGVAILIIGIVAGFFVGKYIYTLKSTPMPLPPEASAKEGDPTANWKTYSDSDYGLTLKFPKDWVVSQKAIEGAHTIFVSPAEPNYGNVSKGRGAQLIIGSPFIYSTSGAICANQSCDKTYDLTIDIDGKKYPTKIIHAYVGNWYDYSTFRIEIDKISITATYISNLDIDTILKILSTFKFVDQAMPGPTCKPRPACLDTTPRCMIPETSDMCPPNQKL